VNSRTGPPGKPDSPTPASDRGHTFWRYGLKWFEVRALLTNPKLSISLAERGILFAMWEREGRDNGLVWAAVATLGRMASMSERRAREILAKLVDRKLVSLERKGGGCRRPNMYTVRWDRLVAVAALANAAEKGTDFEAVVGGSNKEPEPEMVSDLAGIHLGASETVSVLVGNPGDPDLKGCRLQSETRSNPTPDHGFDHGLDHVVITGDGAEGVTLEDPSEPAAPTVAELQARIIASGEALGGVSAQRARTVAEEWARQPGATIAARNKLLRIAEDAGTSLSEAGFPGVDELEAAAAGVNP